MLSREDGKPVPQIDVVIPAFNAESYIYDTLVSASKQTFPVNQIIVVNDGSTDRTSEIVQKFAAEHPQVKILLCDGKNTGGAASRNFGFMQSRADWIAFLDADDLWYPNKILEQVKLSMKYPEAGLIYCDYDVIDSEGKFLAAETLKRVSPTHNEKITQDLLLRGNRISGSNSAVMIKRQLLVNQSYDPSLRLVEDWDLWLRLSLLTRFVFVDKPLVALRRHASNVSLDLKMMISGDLQVLKKHRNLMQGKTVAPIYRSFEVHPFSFLLKNHKDFYRYLCEYGFTNTDFIHFIIGLISRKISKKLFRKKKSGTRKIVVEVVGGLGNQMFQYAVGRALALHHKADLFLDIEAFKKYKLRTFELDIFKIKTQFASHDLLETLKPSKKWGLRRILERMGIRRSALRREREAFLFEEDLLFKSKTDLYLQGYWQSYRYFEAYRDVIASEFEPRATAKGLNAELIERCKTVPVISLHVRRGDYVSNPDTAKFHGAPSLEYYQNAIKIVLQKIPHGIFYVFSDDIPWCKQNLSLPREVFWIDHNQGKTSFEDIRLMSNCTAHIIANSSFSWWGAWLAGENSKMVIAPKEWTQALNCSYDDLLPSHWIRLSNKDTH